MIGKITLKRIIKAILPYGIVFIYWNRKQIMADSSTVLLRYKKSLLGFLQMIKSSGGVALAPLFYVCFIKKCDKYLICRPGGGLNDALCRIELCCRYALKHRRKLYIEAGYGSFLSKYNIDKHFILPSYMSTDVIDFINYPASVYPACFTNDIYTYEAISTPQGRKIKEGPFPQFDFNKNYNEQYLIYDNYGGGEESINFMKRVKLKEDLRTHIVSQINKLGVYSAVHIRNTGAYKTNYKPFLDNISENPIHDKLVICTDSHEVQQYCKDLFGDKLVIPTSVPDLGGESLHTIKTQDLESKYKTNIDAITDLFILACSDRLYTTKITCEKLNITEDNAIYSGYSLLAMNLHKRKKIIKKLLSAGK